MPKSSTFILALAACTVLSLTTAYAQQPAATGVAPAQDKTQTTAAPPSSCSRDNALSIIQRQIDLSKTIDQDERRITVLLKTADLTWPLEQDKARATFTDAFDIATRQFKEKGEKDSSEGRMKVQGTDYRYTVITAIAKRDSAWARKLTKQILDEEAENADKTQKDSAQAARTAEKLLSAAISIIGSNQTAALEFARSSLRYPATFYLPFFFFKMWEANHALADQFYAEALTAYSQTTMDQF